jgi:hypothetical protein
VRFRHNSSCTTGTSPKATLSWCMECASQSLYGRFSISSPLATFQLQHFGKPYVKDFSAE